MDESLIRAGVLNMARMWEAAARTPGGRWRRWDDAWAADSTLSTRLLNRVTVIRRLHPSKASGLAQRIMQFYAERPDGGEYLVNDTWATLDLEPYGFTRWWSLPFMVRPPAKAPARESDLEIRQVHSSSELSDFVRTLVEGFDLTDLMDTPTERVLGNPVLADSAMRCWVGVLEDRVVGTSVAYVSDGVVGVYLVSVLPKKRGRGFGEALTWRATLADTVPATLQASEMGLPVYERMGYVTTLRCATWTKSTR